MLWECKIRMVTEEMSQVEEAMTESKRTAEWEDGKLLAKLPMNGNEVHLDDNLPVAIKRLVNQVYKLAPNEEALNEYNRILRKQEESGLLRIPLMNQQKQNAFTFHNKLSPKQNSIQHNLELDWTQAHMEQANYQRINKCMKIYKRNTENSSA
uniref:Uncharacterized protein n=1 Tax=Caenorhabditis japonica TaxID=281687 RepID=A0A8R1ESI4_CAEJA